jgi:hypothetical protein
VPANFSRTFETTLVPENRPFVMPLDKERHYCTEILFSPRIFPECAHEQSIVSLILDCVMSLDSPTKRQEVCDTILLTGRSALLPGLTERLNAELILTPGGLQRAGVSTCNIFPLEQILLMSATAAALRTASTAIAAAATLEGGEGSNSSVWPRSSSSSSSSSPVSTLQCLSPIELHQRALEYATYSPSTFACWRGAASRTRDSNDSSNNSSSSMSTTANNQKNSKGASSRRGYDDEGFDEHHHHHSSSSNNSKHEIKRKALQPFRASDLISFKESKASNMKRFLGK